MHEMITDLRERMETNGDGKKQRKEPVRLDMFEKWEVAKYMIEQKLVTVDDKGRLTRFRNFEKDIIEEINELEVIPNKKLTGGFHLKDSLDFYYVVCTLTNNLPKIPLQDSVQEEMLKVELHKAMNERDELNRTLDAMNYLFAKVASDLDNMSIKMENAYRSSHDYVKSKKT